MLAKARQPEIGKFIDDAMNLAIRGIDSSQVKWNKEGSSLNDAHKDLKADFVIANTARHLPTMRTSPGCNTSPTTLPRADKRALSWQKAR